MSLETLLENETEWLVRMGVPAWLIPQVLDASVRGCLLETRFRNISVDAAAQRAIEARRKSGGHDWLPPLASH